MDWIPIKTRPKTDILAIVCNDNGYMYNQFATYLHDKNIWLHAEPNYRNTLILEVTHYIPIPPFPMKKSEKY